MLDDLVGVIETLQGRIRHHGNFLQENEIRTRVALIDPLLQALGWDVADPGLVSPEYNVSGQRVDYALLGADGKPAATVEAKKLGESLVSHRMQMLNYSNAAGIAYAGLTDGNQWELYEVFKQVTLEERRLLDLRILDTPAHECALKLLLLWRPNLATGRPAAAVEPIISPPVAPVAPPPAAPVVDMPPSVIQPVSAGWIQLSNFQYQPGQKAPAIRLPDRSEKTLRSWVDVLVEVAEYLVRTGHLTADRCPIPAPAGTRYIVHREPVHSDGKNFTQARVLSNGFSCETNTRPDYAVGYARFLLQRFGVDAGAVWLRLNL